MNVKKLITPVETRHICIFQETLGTRKVVDDSKNEIRLILPCPGQKSELNPNKEARE